MDSLLLGRGLALLGGNSVSPQTCLFIPSVSLGCTGTEALAPKALERGPEVVSQVSSVQREVFLLPLTCFSSLFWIFTSFSGLCFLNP